MQTTADIVAGVIRRQYPTLQVPFHARWRHFVVGGRDLWAELAATADWPDAQAKARAAFDLAITSVLLDAGAGPSWRFLDALTCTETSRSEGLRLTKCLDQLAARCLTRLGNMDHAPFAIGLNGKAGARSRQVPGRVLLPAIMLAAYFADFDAAMPFVELSTSKPNFAASSLCDVS